MTIEPVRLILASLGTPYALIGAHAMAARGYPRFTVDVDLFTLDVRVLDHALWEPLERYGATIDPRRGDEDDPLAGVVHIVLSDATDIDIVVGKWHWEARVLERTEVMMLAGVSLPVPRLSDLILLKLAAGGYLDLHDAGALLQLGAPGERDALVREVEAAVDDVYPDVRELWQQLRASIAH